MLDDEVGVVQIKNKIARPADQVRAQEFLTRITPVLEILHQLIIEGAVEAQHV
jgi:hypothetical protein